MDFIYSDLDHAARMQLLAKTAIKRETMTFKRSLTPTDLEDRKDAYTREAMRLATVKEEFKEYKARKAADIKAIEKNQEGALECIANESVEVFDEVFLIPKADENLILFVDKSGEIVHRREMKPDERQGRLMLEGGTVAGVGDDQNQHIEEAVVVVEDEPKQESEPLAETAEKEKPKRSAAKRGPKKKKDQEPTATGEENSTPEVEESEEVKAYKGAGIPVADPDAMQRIKEDDEQQ